MRYVILGLCLLASACGSSQQATDSQELVLKGDAIASQIQASLAGTKGEFHSDRITADGKRLPGCFIQLGPMLSDKRFEFSLPDRVIDLGYAGEIVYKINDVRLSSVDVTSAGGEFILGAKFASNDVALKGSHSWLGDAVVPDIKLDNMRLTVHLKPVVTEDGRITYDKPKVEFTADVDNTFIPRFSVMGRTVDVVDALTNYRRDLCYSIQRQMQKALDDPARKASLASKIADGISGQIGGGKSAVLGLRFDGTDLIVRLRR